MAQEKEIKIQLRISLEDFLKRIQTRGFKLLHTIKQTDIYFDTPDWWLYEHLAALRLRKVNGKDSSFSFKKMFYLPSKQDRYYIEEIEANFPFEEINNLNDIFERVNITIPEKPCKTGGEITKLLRNYKYFDEQIMPKTRQVFRDGENEIVVDEIDQVGVIVELECSKDEPLEVVKQLLGKDEWYRSLEGTSYIWLKNVKGRTSHLSNLEKFKSAPDWNVWENERVMYEKLIDF